MVQVKNTKQEISPGKEEYRFVFESLSDAVVVVDLETELVIGTNQQGTILLGRSRDEVIGEHYLQNHPPEKADEYRWRFARHVQKGRAADFDGEIVRKDGVVVPVNISASTLQVGERRIMIGLFRDITERKRAEEALKESESRYRDLFNNANNAVFITDLNGRIVEANQAANTLSGYTVKEMAGMDISEIFSAEGREIAGKIHRALIKYQASTQHGELHIIRKDGIRVPVELVNRLLINNGQPVGFHALFRDITHQQRFKENMHFYIAQIIKAQEEERKRIARDIHDEAAQALATLSLDIEGIAKARDLPDEMLERLEGLRNKTSVMLEGVRRLCYELRPDVLDHLGLVPALEWLNAELKNEKRIKGHIEVMGDERRLTGETELALFRITQEALSNVKKHSKATKVVVNVRFLKTKVHLSITDNGRGFELPRIAGDYARKGKLGLIGIQERVHLLNGTFSVISHGDKGTTLRVEVPG